MLYDLIETHAKDLAESGDWDGVLAKLNDPTQGVKDPTLRNFRWLIDEFDTVLDVNTGATEADLIISTLDGSDHPRVKAANKIMANEGIDLSNDQSQLLIDTLASQGGWTDDLRDRVKSCGVSSQTLGESSGVPNLTSQVCEDHWNAGVAVKNSTAIYSDERVLFSYNSNPKGSSYNLRRIPVGEMNGVPIKGRPINVGGLASTATGKELVLVNAIQSAINEYIGD